jgi:hypothetical protein
MRDGFTSSLDAGGTPSHRIDVLGVRITLAAPSRLPEHQTPATNMGHVLLYYFPSCFWTRSCIASTSLASGLRWRRHCDHQSARCLRPMWGTASSPLLLSLPLQDLDLHHVDVLGFGITLAALLQMPECQISMTDVGHGLLPSTTSPAASGLGVAPRQCPWCQDHTGNAVANTRAPDACDRCGAWPPPLCHFPHPFQIRTRTMLMSLMLGSCWQCHCDCQSARHLRPVCGTASSPLSLSPLLLDLDLNSDSAPICCC